ncbi:hypothetical protein TRP8649_03617 [Pelagimonas phthalicica]|uniref:Uncharacterized protein n=1 Tax=Pelagimonas phthalicica TaxID=1037362 RepID=A0A238JFK7_9RHOB|nr:hypothetical protein [Pelagimonas phthalicica]TDS92420.1 hypothetical protein CLV87_3615 [Pelagimonas phthalicica]SMX29481.1 hypothetical protein TRP8649_03617 [Pelagimonas phthalicica]
MARATRQGAAGIPLLAMVDAFVGGTAILLIFLILSSKPSPTDGAQPYADVTLRCAEGKLSFVTLPEWWALSDSDSYTPKEAMALLANTPSPDALLLRVRLEADPNQGRCALSALREARSQNNESDVWEENSARALLAVSMVLVPPPEANP